MTTAVLKFQSSPGNSLTARALLDSCSNANLMTSNFATRLKLPTNKCFVNIGAVDNTSVISDRFAKAVFYSTYNNVRYQLNFLIVPEIANRIPNEVFPREQFHIPRNIKLADPQFHIPRAVDVLLASGTTLSSLAIGQIELEIPQSKITLQKTSFGWIVAGGSTPDGTLNNVTCNAVKLDQLLERFFTIEDLDYQPIKAPDDIASEEHYVKNTTRDEFGRYTVRLPFRDINFDLGTSRLQALKRFHALERKFQANPRLKIEYEKEINSYLELGHMTLCDSDNDEGYYLPHHAVLKESSDTTKCRVVFDASAKSSTGISLNDVLLTGPTIQETLLNQIFHFRTYPFVLTADIEKMYKQVWVHPSDRRFQKIFWYHEDKVRSFTLNTVTFGVKCAPFLAIRTLHQLATDEEAVFPRAAMLLRRRFYVDDFLFGAETLHDILTIRDEMIQLLSRGGFVIRKWSSNHPSALENIDKKIFELDCGIQGNPIKKTLGVIWDSQHDVFTCSVEVEDPALVSTKRRLLSQIAKIFDPLGLLGPVILYAKALVQECWRANITWDESLPQSIHTKWEALAERLPLIQQLAIPRHLRCENSKVTEIHGFCDASFNGYSACLFVRSINATGRVTMRLACSKSKVASLNHNTIPRLELAGATLLKRTYVNYRNQLDFPIKRVIFWSDSMIVLCWLKKPPHVLKTYESNRVKDIQQLDKEVEWRHIRSKDNPADSLSRGQLPDHLLNNSLWTSGPQWLKLPENEWPQSPIISSPVNSTGFKEGIVLLNSLGGADIYSRFSDYGRLIRSIAYLLRWRRKEPLRDSVPTTEKSKRGVRYLSSAEIAYAERLILLLIQRENFSTEIKLLRSNDNKATGTLRGTFRNRTKFDEISPFLDGDGLIRVGGRLKNSNLPFNQKHPILLPQGHHVSDLIISDAHRRNLHGGIQSTLHTVRERFWILNGKNQVRHIVHRCVPCIRQKPRFSHAKMADLPAARVTPSVAFAETGVDFFGPILIKEKKDRNRSFIKAYGCVFVCMASKAVHIEVASDLTTGGFLACFRRFISIRGRPLAMHSDNGTNFVGANNELKKIYDLHATAEFKNAIQEYAISKRIEWNFNPPLSPHFGGLWEAAVKSFKHHLNRMMKDQSFTYEQLDTLLKEIAAILNSRPLYVDSADPNDPLVITPAHLLIGRSFNKLLESDVVSVSDNRLSIYQRVTKIRQDFWKRWYKEYLHELQTRRKWLTSATALSVGSVVVSMEDNSACSRWPLGVVLEVHPGSDGIARVATIKTSTGVFKRNITRLCVLPLEQTKELQTAF
ncbi:uncharacterized protein LOC131668296 [Phymastichus coffea]|uniref:uncharacterized protein LOC131668296 n=1 Tax=Phymastichus coffea TaxID=108790 RepID=UPI00273C8A65|nr:uncharacterized protein LOC131668296 [Phymastichus coffea]